MLFDETNYTVQSYDFENLVNSMTFIQFMIDNWTKSIWISLMYVILVFTGRRLMDSRERFSLTSTLTLWNAMLALFSIFGTIRVWPELIYTLKHEGFYGTVCTTSWMSNQVNVFWTTLFILSKVVELGDTVFIVLRKQPLIFLHWYHHVTVFIYTWYSTADLTSSGRWYVGMNYAVHAVMYSYYTARSLKFKVPKLLRMGITALQILQMIVGCIVGIYAYNMKRTGQYCHVTYTNLHCSCLMYLTYFILFAKFFYEAYLGSRVTIKRDSNQNELNDLSKKLN